MLSNNMPVHPVHTLCIPIPPWKPFYTVPFVVLVGLHKLSPLFASDPNATLNDLQSPGDIIPYDDVCQHLAAADDAHGTKIPPNRVLLLVVYTVVHAFLWAVVCDVFGDFCM